MKECLNTCRKMNVACPINECRYWVDYPDDRNCTFEVVAKHNFLTLREAAARLGISYVRVKQIEDKALKKISHLLKDEAN